MVFLLSLLFLGIIILEVPKLVRGGMWRELVVFSVLLVIGMAYSYAQLFNIPLPNPTNGLEAVFKPLSIRLEKMLI